MAGHPSQLLSECGNLLVKLRGAGIGKVQLTDTDTESFQIEAFLAALDLFTVWRGKGCAGRFPKV
jgi:hypothetical protein